MSHQPSGGISVGREASSPACDRVSDLAPYARSRASWPGRFETRLTAVTRPMQPTAKMSARSKPVEAVGRLSRSVIAFDLSAKFPIGRAAHGFGHPRSQVRKFLEDFILRDSDNPSSVERLSRQFSKPRIASVLEERLRRHVVRDPSLDKCHPPLRHRLLRLPTAGNRWTTLRRCHAGMRRVPFDGAAAIALAIAVGPRYPMSSLFVLGMPA